MSSKKSDGHAQAIAIEKGKFVAVGTNEKILSLADETTKKLDLKNKTVVPGFIDTHVHGEALGDRFSQMNLRNVKSIKDIQQRVKNWVNRIPEGQWILGRGWDQDKLAEHRYPSISDLDQVAPRNPVFLLRVCGHLGVTNSRALQLAGINKDTKLPQGGYIDKSLENAEPSGIVGENALELIYRVLPVSNERTLMDVCFSAVQKMVEKGITTVHWIVSSPKEILALQKLESDQRLPLRIYLIIPIEHLNKLAGLGIQTGFGDDKIKIGCVKILADGSLGARTAALKQPYSDAPGTRGMLLYSKKQLKNFVEKTHKADLQLAIHAIGDRTIEMVLEILEKVLQKRPKEQHRHRLEHASVLSPRLINKMKNLGIVVSVQPHFAISDSWLINRLGESRARQTYAFKSLISSGIIAIGGSDAPIEPVDPLLGIYAAVNGLKYPQERLSLDEAFRIYTVDAAYGSFEEDVKGSIEIGKLADLVVLSKDPYKTSLDQVGEIKVELTMVGGTIVFRSSDFQKAALS
ncbi:MAG: amidohydrolase [Candidatus Bathyarchaeota archaeon]|nr:MAG: amidohydrolase [Candidatus Bathyarchaeota archaeon]